ncbi:MAG TPA: cupin domain-containing protein [Kofleriaceae bacterium]|nr:cupin domain-containing protein [Kofleriaceae bacterium]
MSERRHKQVVNIDEVAVREEARGGFGFRTRRLGLEASGRAIGCSHFEIPPGKTSFPFHWHSAMEEALYILEGTGAARIGADTVEVRAGDYIAYPPGPATSHTITNTGTTPLRYLALSGNASPVTMDIVGYPDSKKIAYASGVDPQKGPRAGGWILGLHKEQSPTDYYLDEPIASKE